MKTPIVIPILLTTASLAGAATTINSTNAYAYGANIGWITARGDTTNGVVIGEYVCSGFMWGANVGWISLGNGSPANGIQYGNASATDFGVNLTGQYISGGVSRAQLRGFAYGANIGWINFEATGNPEITLSNGKLSGYAWSANCGWINLGDATTFVQTDTIQAAPDSDADGIADAYEFANTNPDSLLILTATGDADGDGFSDVREFLANTNPRDASSYLKVTAFTGTSTTYNITWTSSPSRLYRIDSSTTLANNSWTQVLAGIVPDGATTTRSGATATSPKRFFRVQAIRPLVP